MNLDKAYQLVYEDMMNSGCGILQGKYDARNGERAYMNGIWSVMEWIATMAGEAQAQEFDKMFATNLAKSEKKA